MSEDPVTLANLPPEVLLDELLPLLPTADLLRLARSSEYFASLCSDETLWKHKLRQDFNFTGAGTARRSGWKFIYQGLANPKVFVWGDRNNGRLGLRHFPRSGVQGVPFPTQLHIPGGHIISIVAGGMSFHALDTKGNVFVWGTLNGEFNSYALQRDGYSEGGKIAQTPLRLQLPNPVRSISCGRLHSAVLDSAGIVWNLVNWGRPFQLSSSLIASVEPLQLECGWNFTSLLAKTGDVLVWWPKHGTLLGKIRAERDRLNMADIGRAYAKNGVIPCHTWAANVDPVRLPPLPILPKFGGSDGSDDYKKNPHRLIQIAAMDAHIVGLTNYGHVLKIGGLENEESSPTEWKYLPKFSEVAEVRNLPEFSSESTHDLKTPEVLKVTHISAGFNRFFAFSTGENSIILQGELETTPTSNPKIIPEVQNKNIIQVAVGDYHNAALSVDGKLFTWGAFSNGALGLGDPVELPVGTPGGFRDEVQLGNAQLRRFGTPPEVGVPTEVRFDHGRKNPKDRFCFAVTAAGWHTGALVIDLEPDEHDEEQVEVEQSDDDPDEFMRHNTRWQNPPLLPLHGGLPFHRIGFPGRGRGGPPT